MSFNVNFNISEIASLLCLERKRRCVNGERSFDVKCPFCGKNKYHLNIDNRKNVWRCVKCGEHGGMIDLYLRVAKGLTEQECTKGERKTAIDEINRLLNRKSCVLPACETAPVDDYTHLSDSELNEVYSKILEVPELKLSWNHRNNLLARGLHDSDISANGYRTMPDEILPDKIMDSEIIYRMGDISKIHIEGMSQKRVFAGLYIAAYLSEKFHLKLKDVPGFFKTDGRWCFAYTPGLLIPVRNISGEIVNFQTRTENGKSKYITVSSKRYEEGTSGECRVHFPVCNPKIGPDTVIRLTEGPLKADAAASMTTEPNTAYMAVMGINASASLGKVLRQIKETGCAQIVNTLDMDRLTNPYVAKGSKKLGEIVRGAGLKYRHLFWDTETAEQIAKKQEKLMLEFDIASDKKKKSKSVFQTVSENTMMFFSRGIEMPRNWPNKNTKGIDDFELTKKAVPRS